MVLVQGTVKYRTDAFTDKLGNRPERHQPTPSYETYTGPVSRRLLLLGDLIGFGKPSSEGVAAKHYPGSPASIEMGG